MHAHTQVGAITLYDLGDEIEVVSWRSSDVETVESEMSLYTGPIWYRFYMLIYMLCIHMSFVTGPICICVVGRTCMHSMQMRTLSGIYV